MNLFPSILIILHLCSSYILATSPGKNIFPIQVLELEVNLFIVDININNTNIIKGVRVAWVPKEVQNQCLNLSIDSCSDIIHELRFPSKAQKQTLFSHNTKIITEALHVNIQRKDYQLMLSKFRMTQEAKRLVADKNIQRNSDLNYEHPMFMLDNSKRIRTKIQWTLWPNGSSFQILEFINGFNLTSTQSSSSLPSHHD